MADISGTPGNDSLVGTSGDDTIHGGAGNDSIDGNGGKDVITGDEGDDFITVGAARHDVDGGSGIDTLRVLAPAPDSDGYVYGYTVDLRQTGTARLNDGSLSWRAAGLENVTGSSAGDFIRGSDGANILAGEEGYDSIGGNGGDDLILGDGSIRYSNGQIVITETGIGADSDSLGGGDGNDRLVGGGGDDFLGGGNGNDRLEGGDGSDSLFGDFGDDVLDGGTGKDIANYSHRDPVLGGVNVSLAVQGVPVDMGAFGMDTLFSIENLYGSVFSDHLTGDDGANWLFGGAPADVNGSQSINDDTISGLGGDDMIEVSLGNHSLDGGSGSDTLGYNDAEGGFREPGQFYGPVTLSLALQGSAQASGYGSWTLNGIENLSGWLGNDVLTGDGNANVLAGAGGSDTLTGGAGNDVLLGDGQYLVSDGEVTLWENLIHIPLGTFVAIEGNDILDGGTGDDRMVGGRHNDIYYVDSSGDVVVEQSNEGNDEVRTGLATYTLAANVEKLTGQSSAGQWLTGNDLANNIVGGSGNDILDGGIGGDVLNGGLGNDSLRGNTDSDALDGGDGDDVLQGGEGDDVLNGGAGNDSLYGNTSFAEVFANDDDILNGGSGDDLLLGGAGDDQLNGGTGNDVLLEGQGGNNILNGDDGDDQIEASGLISAGVYFTNILSGGAGNDRLVASDSNGSLSGGDGNDVLIARGGPLSMDGGIGDDELTLGQFHLSVDGIQTATGGAGADRFIISDASRSSERDRILDFNAAEGDRLTLQEVYNGRTSFYWPLENAALVFSGFLDPAGFVFGSALPGGDLGTGFVQLFFTHSGGNTYLIADSNGDLVFDDQDMVVEFAGTLTLTASSFVTGTFTALIGTAAGETLTGSTANDSIYGLSGNDILVGGGGFDALYGGSGNDLLDSSASSQSFLDGGAGDDRLIGGQFADTLNGGAGSDLIEGGLGADQINGGIDDDILRGEGDSDFIDGGDGADLLEGGDGDDSLNGFTGDDILRGGPGSDSLFGHDGIDTADYSDAPGGVAAILSGGFQNTLAGGFDNISATIENLTGSNFDDSLTGDGGANFLRGLDGADYLAGMGSNDTLDGGAGADQMNGGTGNDIFIVDNAGDLVGELAGEGTDEVRTALASYTLAANVELLTGTGAVDQSLTGNGGDNIIDGGLGADTMTGGLGNDVYFVDNAGDVAVELAGEGIDEVRTAMAVYSIAGLTNVETLTATSSINHDLRGNSGDNLVTGAGGNDFIRLQDGGVDVAVGAGGNDVFLFGATLTSADAVDGGAGLDQVAIQGDYSGGLTLGAGFVSVESFAILPGSDTRFGDTAGNFYDYNLTTLNANVAPGVLMIIDANRLRAGEDFTFNGSAETDGNFFLYGGGGTDTMLGGSNNDTFYFGENGQFGASDHVDGGVSGIDQLGLRGSYTIVFGANQLVSIESIGLVSAQDTRFGALGSSYNYNLTMNDGNLAAGVRMTVDAAPLRPSESLTFDGSAETDGWFRIFGGQGSDTITGSQTADIISGGLGSDSLRGAGGADTFLYRSVADSLLSARDSILDFSSGDRIDLSQIDAVSGTPGNDAFTFIGSAAFSGTAGEVRATFFAGNGLWTVSGDVNGDGVADIEFFVSSDHPIVGTDFVL